ncbi:conserved Plasmodium protein, unknown function [Plasmodium gallinaceum]|uniref:TTI1 C-terminal TPR domain-containing protein n=1 Tax=Plasmodium gallinaceum TaxID=5849 RepID=A0A1J1GLN7_PLAGA|nr:conserved Plasmodium protein, unknown function [Plasmodium gallinaceum]CRG93289.1 conserved Plasmodium protein, unknown function [Plasmodium gallinaceum]
MESQNDIISSLILFIKKNSIDDDLIYTKKIYHLIKKNKISSNLKIFDERENIFYSISSIICNKLKIYIYILKNENVSIVFKNSILENKINDYIKNYDMCSIPKSYLVIEYFLKVLTFCFNKINNKDKIFFFRFLNNISLLLELEYKENSINKGQLTIFSEELNIIIIKYIKNLFIYVCPFNIFENINEYDLINIDKNVECYDSNKDYDLFSCLVNVIKIILENIINKNKKIKLKSLKLLYTIHQKIENVFIIKKLFKGVSLNLFILYKSCDIKNLRSFIIKIFYLCFDKILMHYSCIQNNFTILYLKNEWIDINKVYLNNENYKNYKNYFTFLKENSLTKMYFTENEEKEKPNTQEEKNENINSDKKVYINKIQDEKKEVKIDEIHDEKKEVKIDEIHDEKKKVKIDEIHDEKENIEIDENKKIISNIYFISYYILINYDDNIKEIFNLCKIIIKYFYLLNKNLVLMSFFFILSQMLYDDDNFFTHIYFLFNKNIIEFFELNNIYIEDLDEIIRILNNKNSSNLINFKNKKFENCDEIFDTKKRYDLIYKNTYFYKDLYSIFFNLIKLLKTEENNCSLNNISNYSIENLNHNIGDYYFKYLYNIFLFQKQDNTFLLNFLRGFFYYNFINKQINKFLFQKKFNLLDYILHLYEISDFSCVKNQNNLSFSNYNLLSEDNTLYSLNIYENKNEQDNHFITDNIEEEINFHKFQNIKDGFKFQNISLINGVSIFFFLFTDENEINNYLDEILFSRWYCNESLIEKKIEKDNFVLKNKWWEDIYYFTDSKESNICNDNHKKEIKEKKEKIEKLKKNTIDKKEITDEIYKRNDIEERKEESYKLEDKYKCLHFINFYLDSIIIILYVHFKLMIKKKKDNLQSQNINTNINLININNYYEKILQNDLLKNVLREYSNVFNIFFSLAIKIKFLNFNINIKKMLEKIILFLTSNNVKKDEIKLRREVKKDNVYIYYYISLLMICLNKCFCVLFLCMYDDLLEKYFYKILTFLMFNINSSSSYVKELSKYTLLNIHYYLSESKENKKNGSFTRCDGNIEKTYICINEENKKDKYNISNIIKIYNDIIASYIYKKIINIDSFNSCNKILNITKFLAIYNYHTYIYKDICLNLIKYTKKLNFSYLSYENKNEIIINILNIFNCILYIFYKYIINKRIQICNENNYFIIIKNLLFQGFVYINFNNLKDLNEQYDKQNKQNFDKKKKDTLEKVLMNEENKEILNKNFYEHINGNKINKNEKTNDNNLFEKCYKFNNECYSSIVHKDVKKKKKKLFLYNFFFFKFYDNIFGLDYFNIISNNNLKNEYSKIIKEDMKNIIREIKKNIKCKSIVNVLIDDDFYDINDEENKKKKKKKDNNENQYKNNLYDNKYFENINYKDLTYYANIRYTVSHIFNFSKRFLCQENIYIRFNSYLCILRCLFVFSTRLFELYPKIHQIWGYIKINFSNNTYMNNIVALNIINYIITIDDKYSFDRILSDIIPQIFDKLKSFEVKNEISEQTYEYKFLFNVMIFFLNISKEEKYFEQTHPDILFFCLKCLNKTINEKIKKISLNIICNLYLNNISKIKKGIENLIIIKDRINFFLNGENITEKQILDNIFLKENVKDVLLIQPLYYISCLLKIKNLKEIVSLIIHLDQNLLNFLIFYFSFLNYKYKYKCGLNQHSLIVFNHFKYY